MVDETANRPQQRTQCGRRTIIRGIEVEYKRIARVPYMQAHEPVTYGD